MLFHIICLFPQDHMAAPFTRRFFFLIKYVIFVDIKAAICNILTKVTGHVMESPVNPRLSSVSGFIL